VSERTPHPPYALEPDRVVLAFGTDAARGLTSADAAARLARDGPNELERAHGPAYGRIVARQLVEPLVGLLVAATVVSAAIGETVEAAAIGRSSSSTPPSASRRKWGRSAPSSLCAPRSRAPPP
jgi:magnesium-transporting ATPase (P-type)